MLETNVDLIWSWFCIDFCHLSSVDSSQGEMRQQIRVKIAGQILNNQRSQLCLRQLHFFPQLPFCLAVLRVHLAPTSLGKTRLDSQAPTGIGTIPHMCQINEEI